MNKTTNSPHGLELAALESLVAGRREEMDKMERRRQAYRSDPVELRAHDENCIGHRIDLAETYLALSMKRERSGNHQGALDAARLYAEQEFLAKSLRDRLLR